MEFEKVLLNIGQLQGGKYVKNIINWRRKKEMIHFSGRRHTKLGILSTIIGIVVVLGFIAISIISSSDIGEGSLLIGVIGLLLLAIAIFGFVISYKAFKEIDIFYTLPIIGSFLNGTMMVVLLILYILGIGM